MLRVGGRGLDGRVSVGHTCGPVDLGQVVENLRHERGLARIAQDAFDDQLRRRIRREPRGARSGGLRGRLAPLASALTYRGVEHVDRFLRSGERRCPFRVLRKLGLVPSDRPDGVTKGACELGGPASDDCAQGLSGEEILDDRLAASTRVGIADAAAQLGACMSDGIRGAVRRLVGDDGDLTCLGESRAHTLRCLGEAAGNGGESFVELGVETDDESLDLIDRKGAVREGFEVVDVVISHGDRTAKHARERKPKVRLASLRDLTRAAVVPTLPA